MQSPSDNTASSRHFRSSSNPSGDQTFVFGTERAIPTSKSPWCVTPSPPTNPARSTQITTCRFCIAISCMSWSKHRCKNEEYTANTGIFPAAASPAQKVTACSSAIPTSKNRSGNPFEKPQSPVPSHIAAVTAQIAGSRFAKSQSILPNSEENVFLSDGTIPFSVSNGATA